MMIARMPALEPSLPSFHEKHMHLPPLHSAPLPQLHHERPRSSPAGSPSPSEEAYKGSWTEMEDDCLRRYAEVRNATSTACDASRCRNKCVETACPHHWCTEDVCQHGRCTEQDCMVPNYIYRRPMPEGSLVLRPLEVTLCHHLTNTEKLWTEIASLVSRTCQRKRNAKQCRERWFQQLRPGLILHLPIQPEEGELIAQLVTENGQKWAAISRHPQLQRRSDNAIKNWWNSSGNKKDRAATRGSRLGPVSAQRVHKARAQHRPSRSESYMSRAYDYAVVGQRDARSTEPATLLPPINGTSPVLHGRSFSTSPSRELSRVTSQPGPPAGYHARRRESTLSISTSRSTSHSGPSTPMTSSSMHFGHPSGESRPPTTSPKDPRMSIDALCGA